MALDIPKGLSLLNRAAILVCLFIFYINLSLMLVRTPSAHKFPGRFAPRAALGKSAFGIPKYRKI